MAGHTTVLLHEAVDALITDSDGIYVDGTFGRGGHSAEILARLSSRGAVLAIDKDPQAIAVGRERFAADPRIELVHGSFADLGELLAQRGMTGRVSGVLVDLGVSSPQLDDAERGFSFLRDGPLDMRMNTESGISAAQWIATASEAEIERVISDYGEERFARRMASSVVRERGRNPITRTGQLAEILKAAHPAWERGKHPATQAFQAIRIFINRELEDLDALLGQVVDALRVGGRLVVISFHSLEDRRVKRFIRDQQRGPQMPRKLPVIESDRPARLKKIGAAVRAGERELESNIRARSAVMRVAEKVA